MQPEAKLTIEVCCDQCGRSLSPIARMETFIEMAPKIGTQVPFYLCVKHWLSDYRTFDGAKPTGRLLEQPPPPIVVAPPPAEPPPKKTRGKTA